MTRAVDLVEGRVYFVLNFTDELMLYPCVRSYVFLGANVHGSIGPKPRHFFQTVESFHEVGNWASMSSAERDNLGPDAVIVCEDIDGLISSTAEFIELLLEYQARAAAVGS